jgi:hypothetical protein
MNLSENYDSENFNSIPKITISENSDLNTRSTKNHENVPILNEEEGLRKRKASSFSSDSNSDPSGLIFSVVHILR